MPKAFLGVNDIKEIVGCCEKTAYNLIQKMNAEQKKKGRQTIKGRVSKSYFEANYGIKVES